MKIGKGPISESGATCIPYVWRYNAPLCMHQLNGSALRTAPIRAQQLLAAAICIQIIKKLGDSNGDTHHDESMLVEYKSCVDN